MKPRTILASAIALAIVAIKAIFDVTVQDYWKDTASPYVQAHLAPWGWAMLELIGPFGSGVILTLIVVLLSDLFFAWRVKSSSKRRYQPYFAATSINGETINVSDLTQFLVSVDAFGALTRKTFVGCTFVGPACVYFNGGTTFGGNVRLDEPGTPLAVSGGMTIVGALPLTDCTFIDCTFKYIQLLLPEGEPYNSFYKLADEYLPARRFPFQPS